MTLLHRFAAAVALALGLGTPAPALAQDGPLRIEITEGVIEPMPIAVPRFTARDAGGGDYADRIARVITSNLSGTGLFREIPREAHIAELTDFNDPVSFSDWRAINTEALVTGSVAASNGRVTVQFRLHDVVSGREMGEGLQFEGAEGDWRRMAHKVSDEVYSRLTGEDGYFDSRVAFVAETGPREDREKRLAVMDQDGENAQYLSEGASLVLAPRFSPDGDRLLYTSYEDGFPRIYLLNLRSMERRVLDEQPGTMTFAPRFAPDGQSAVFSLSRGGSTDIYRLNLNTGERTQLTNAPYIATAPSFSPDGDRIVFESDRSGTQQLYVMSASGGEPRRISRGEGRYATPVWSPRGDRIAFTKSHQGRFHVGVMNTDGSEERLLTASYLDEGPTWAPNGRVIMFMRENPGAEPELYSVDISGRNLRRIATPGAASDPAWSPLMN